jgi:MoaA/NifB/PqqE/SkfB family radical SAM enzyme
MRAVKADSAPTFIPLDIFEQRLDFLDRSGIDEIRLIGGEPTLHPQLPELIRHARAAGFEEVCVYTNGTRFTPAVKAALREHAVDLAFSVYAATAAVHDGITGRAGSFEKTIAAIRWARESSLRVRAGVIAMPENAAHMAATRQLLGELGVSDVHVDPVRKLGRGQAYGTPDSELGELCGRCGSGKLCVSASGEIFPCVFSRFAPLGHFRSAGLAGALGGAPLDAFRADLLDAFARKYPHYGRAAASPASNCSPEEPAPPCNPETPAPPCSPERDPGPCNPEIPPPDCAPEKPSICTPERTAAPEVRAPLVFVPRR